MTKHLKTIYGSGELEESLTCANFAQVADNGKTYQYKFYSLPAIIAVGYRANGQLFDEDYFELVSEYAPVGDRTQAIAELVQGFREGNPHHRPQ